MVLLSAVLTGCGGGNDSISTAESADGTKQALAVSGATAVPPGWTGRAPKYEVINGITVPPAPDPKINNATLKGVDVNANGIRDDVERALATTYGRDKDNLLVGQKEAAQLQKISTAEAATKEETICAAYKLAQVENATSIATEGSRQEISVVKAKTALLQFKDRQDVQSSYQSLMSSLVIDGDGNCRIRQ